MLFEDIMKSINGLGDNKSPKCAFCAEFERYEIGKKEPIEHSERLCFKPELQISKLPGFNATYMMVDIIYESIFDVDFKAILEYLNRYRAEISTVTDDSTEIPQVNFTFIPMDFKGQYYIVANTPIFWCETRIDETRRALRILFPAEYFTLYETSSVDYDKIMTLAENTAIEEAEREAKIMIEEEEKKAQKAELYNAIADARDSIMPNPAELAKSYNTENGVKINPDDYLNEDDF